MKSGRFSFAIFVACIVAAVVAPPAAGQGGKVHIALPADLAGTLNGANYRIRVPADWNGTLLVYAHGTRLSGSGGPAEPEVAPQPYPLPANPFEDQLLERGYALAGAEYENSQQAGTKASHALTAFFNGAVGRPSRVVAWGCSLGGVVATMLIEKYPGIYDGAIACAGPLAGQARNMDASLAFALAYDVTFGWRSDLWGPVDDLRDDLVFMSDVMPYVKWPLPQFPARRPKWEFIRLVTKQPPLAFWGVDPQLGSAFLGMQMWRATEARARLETQFRGRVAQNLDHVYALTADEKASLANLGVNADSLLDQMNARTDIEADHSARVLMERWSVDGRLRRPLLTMHSAFDGLARTENESAFLADVEQAGAEDSLVQVFTSAPVHCSFSTTQLLDTLAAMEHWLNTGDRPGAAFFPAADGFAVGYVPPVWPF